MTDGAFEPLSWLRAVLSEGCTLDPYEGVVMLALVRHCDDHGRAFPGFAILCRETRVSRTKLVRALAALERRGLFVRHPQVRGQGLGSNVYDLAVTPSPSALEGLPVRCTTSAPRTLGGTPETLGVVLPETQTSAPGAPYLPNELSNRTAHGSAGARGSAPDGLPKPKPTKARMGSKPRKLEAELAGDWQPSDAHRAFAKQHGLEVELEATAFRGHFEGKTALSWNGRFTTWLANQAKWDRQRGPRRPAEPQRGVVAGVDPSRMGTDSPLMQRVRARAQPQQPLPLGVASGRPI